MRTDRRRAFQPDRPRIPSGRKPRKRRAAGLRAPASLEPAVRTGSAGASAVSGVPFQGRWVLRTADTAPGRQAGDTAPGRQAGDTAPGPVGLADGGYREPARNGLGIAGSRVSRGSIPVRPERGGPPGGRPCVAAAAPTQRRPPTPLVRRRGRRAEWEAPAVLRGCCKSHTRRRQRAKVSASMLQTTAPCCSSSIRSSTTPGSSRRESRRRCGPAPRS